MFNKQLICLAGLFIILQSCGSSASKGSSENALPSPDSLSSPVNVSLQNVMGKFKTKSTLPFLADTTLLFKVSTFDSLGTNEVLALDTSWFRGSVIAKNGYDFSSFYKIDSLKAAGAYAKWCETLDIGMTKHANAYALFKIDMDANTVMLVWSVTVSSYEACPFSSETTIYCTLVHDRFITQSFMLADYLSAGDPPSMMQRWTSGVVNTDGTFKLNGYEEQEDLDEPFAMETRSEYEFVIKDGKVSVVKENAGKEVKVARKRESAVGG